MNKFKIGDYVLINGRRKGKVVSSTSAYCVVECKDDPPEVFVGAYYNDILTICEQEDLLLDNDFEL